MIKYDVWFKEFCLGKLFVAENGEQKYEVNVDAVAQAEKENIIVAEAKTEKMWGEPITFFDVSANECRSDDYYFVKDNH